MDVRRIAGLSVAFSLMLAVAAAGAASAASRPVYFVHGLAVSANSDCAMWGPMMKSFRGWGLKGDADLANVAADEVPFHTVSYYYRDKNCNTDLDASGDHSKVPGPALPPGPQAHQLGSHTTNTSIEHLAYHLAWNIYDTYSSRGRTVDVVAHSMGGLMIRYALAATERGVADFPPYLRVEDVVTLGTPHGGYRAHGGVGLQVAQMVSGSSLMKSLEKYAFNPQGRGGTDWTTAGSDDDTWVAADRAVGTARDRDPRSTSFGSRHKVWYTTQNNIEHSDYYKKNTTSDATATAWVALAGKAFTAEPIKIVHPVRLSFFALRSPNS